jgi:hypothetical protein
MPRRRRGKHETREKGQWLAAGWLAVMLVAGVAWGVQGPDRWMGEFSGDGRWLINVRARTGITEGAWSSPWSVQGGTGNLMPRAEMVPSTIWMPTWSGDLRVAGTATNGVDGLWEYASGVVRPKNLE